MVWKTGKGGAEKGKHTRTRKALVMEKLPREVVGRQVWFSIRWIGKRK